MMRASLARTSLATLATLLAALVAALGLAPAAWAQRRSAEPPPSTVEVTPPAGWSLDAARTAAQAKTLRGGSHLGVAGVRAAAAFYRTTGAALVVSELVAEPAPKDVVGAAKAELASVRSVVEAAEGTLVGWRFQGGEPTLPEAAMEWKDPTVGTTSITRALVFRTADALMVVTAECVLAGDAEAMRGPCESALAAVRPLPSLKRLEVGLGATDPVAATATPPPAAPTAADEPAVDRPEPAVGTGSSNAPTMSERGEIPTTILVRPPSTPKDRRPMLLLIGVAVLVLVFLWNRRQRARLDEAEARERQRADRRSGEPESGSGSESESESEAESESEPESESESEPEPEPEPEPEAEAEADKGKPQGGKPGKDDKERA